MHIEQKDINDNIFGDESLLHVFFLFGRGTIEKKHSKPVKIGVIGQIGADFILFSAQQDYLAALKPSKSRLHVSNNRKSLLYISYLTTFRRGVIDFFHVVKT